MSAAHFRIKLCTSHLQSRPLWVWRIAGILTFLNAIPEYMLGTSGTFYGQSPAKSPAQNLRGKCDQGLTNVLPGGCPGQVQNPAGQVHFTCWLPSWASAKISSNINFSSINRPLVIDYQRDKRWHPTDNQWR